MRLAKEEAELRIHAVPRWETAELRQWENGFEAIVFDPKRNGGVLYHPVCIVTDHPEDVAWGMIAAAIESTKEEPK